MSNELKTPERVPPAGSTRGSGTHYVGNTEEVRALGSFVKLMRAAHWASTRAGRRREEAGLTESQFGVLEALLHLGPLDQTELKNKLLTSPANLTHVLDNLIRDGYVERRRDVADGRRRIVHLAPRGRRLVKRLMPLHAARVVEVMRGLSPREQEQLARLARKLGYWAKEMS